MGSRDDALTAAEDDFATAVADACTATADEFADALEHATELVAARPSIGRIASMWGGSVHGPDPPRAGHRPDRGHRGG